MIVARRSFAELHDASRGKATTTCRRGMQPFMGGLIWQLMIDHQSANLLLKAMMNAWRKIDTATSINMTTGNDTRRNAWTVEDPEASDAVRFTDEMKIKIGISATDSSVSPQFIEPKCTYL